MERAHPSPFFSGPRRYPSPPRPLAENARTPPSQVSAGDGAAKRAADKATHINDKIIAAGLQAR